MKKLSALKRFSLLALILASAMVFAQPDNDIIIIFVGSEASSPTPEDQVAIDSISQWVNVEYYGAAEFNAATIDDLYSTSGTNAAGIIISESIDSKTVPNFGRRDFYPVPAIVMEGVFGTPDNEQKWPLLKADGGIWGYDPPEDVDVQWKIADNSNYITQNYSVGDEFNYADSPSRGVPYIHGIDYEHVILATAARESGGDANPTYVHSEAIALGYIIEPEILYMNVAYTYLPVASNEFYDILHRGVTLAGENEISLNTSEYSRGLYMVRLQIGNKVSAAKLVLK
jgi:hypothetical protein